MLQVTPTSSQQILNYIYRIYSSIFHTDVLESYVFNNDTSLLALMDDANTLAWSQSKEIYSTEQSDPPPETEAATSVAIIEDHSDLHTCSACDEELPTTSFPKCADGSKCTHQADVCAQCWQQWLEVQVAHTSFDQIACVQCDTVLEQHDVKALASMEAFARYILHHDIHEECALLTSTITSISS